MSARLNVITIKIALSKVNHQLNHIFSYICTGQSTAGISASCTAASYPPSLSTLSQSRTVPQVTQPNNPLNPGTQPPNPATSDSLTILPTEHWTPGGRGSTVMQGANLSMVLTICMMEFIFL